MKNYCWLIIAVTLAGCATVKGAHDPLRKELTEHDGLVSLSITLNTSEVMPFDLVQLKQVPDGDEAVVSKDTFQLTDIVPGLSRDTSLFLGALPSGKYRLTRLIDMQTQRSLSLSETQSEVLGTFEVQPGKVTDLGRIIATSVNFKILVGRSDNSKSNNDLIARFAPRYVKFMSERNLSWAEDKDERDIAEQYAKLYVQGLSGLSELSSGEVIAGLRMGSIVIRDPDSKRWEMHAQTGEPEAFLWTTPYLVEPNIAAAVGEMGLFVLVGQDGTLTPVDTGDLPDGNLFFVDHSPETGEWIVGHRLGDRASIFRSTDLDAARWEKLHSNLVAPSFWSGTRKVWAWPQPGGIGYAATEDGVVGCYRYATRSWQVHEAPNDHLVAGVAMTIEGESIGIITSPGGGFGGIFAGTHISNDCGATWQATDSPYNVKMSPPLVLPSGAIIESGGAFGDRGIYVSVDNGVTWNKRADGDFKMVDFWSLPTAGIFSVSRGGFGIETVKHSDDGGATWDAELSNFNKEVFERMGN